MCKKLFVIIITACLSLLMMLTKVYAQGAGEKLLLVCGDHLLHMVDYTKSVGDKPEIVWTWDAHLAEDLPEEFRLKKFNTLDDCKGINGGKQILVSSSSGAIALLDAKDRKVLFYAHVPNAHSIEILPDNLLVAAASTAAEGNRIMLFDMNQLDKVVFSDSLYSAHGVVWDKARESLYALGFDVLREYKLVNRERLSMINEWDIPGKSGHDLYPTHDSKGLFMTEHTGLWLFNKKKASFKKVKGFPDAENIKSMGIDASGQYIYTVPEESWWTYHVSFFQPARKLAFPDMKVYKARWLNE